MASYIDTTTCIDQNCTSHLEKQFLFFSKKNDVMRQTRTSIDNASEHSLTDYWNEDSEIILSEAWIGDDTVPNLEDPSSQKDTNGKWHDLSRRMAQMVKERTARGDRKWRRRTEQIARRSPDMRILRCFTRRHRLRYGDLKESSKHAWFVR